MNLISKRLIASNKKFGYSNDEISKYFPKLMPSHFDANSYDYIGNYGELMDENCEIVQDYRNYLAETLSKEDYNQAFEDLDLSPYAHDYEIVESLSEHKNNIPDSWKDVIPKLHKLYCNLFSDRDCDFTKEQMETFLENVKATSKYVTDIMKEIEEQHLTERNANAIHELCESYLSSNLITCADDVKEDAVEEFAMFVYGTILNMLTDGKYSEKKYRMKDTSDMDD